MIIAERYEVAGKIGTGGMADVYKAKDHKAEPLCGGQGPEAGISGRTQPLSGNSEAKPRRQQD